MPLPGDEQTISKQEASNAQAAAMYVASTCPLHLVTPGWNKSNV
jgi:hypothetical protein